MRRSTRIRRGIWRVRWKRWRRTPNSPLARASIPWRAPANSLGNGLPGLPVKCTRRREPALERKLHKPSALFLTPEAPYPIAGGGSLRSASLLEYLARRYDVDVIVFRQPGAP